MTGNWTFHGSRLVADDPRVDFFDRIAATWDEQKPSQEAMVEHLSVHSDLLGLAAGHQVLEVGCGTGRTTGWLAARVAPGRVTAVDFSPRMIEQARAKRLDAELVCLDVCSESLRPDAFDVALCFHSFPHFRDRPAALANLARSLRPGGRLIIFHMSGSERINGFHSRLEGPVRHDVLPVADEWTGLLGPAGLRQEELIDRDDLYYVCATRLVD